MVRFMYFDRFPHCVVIRSEYVSVIRLGLEALDYPGGFEVIFS